MTLGNTFRIGTTTYRCTNIMTLGYTIGFGAFSMRWTIIVGLTFHRSAAALIIGISHQPWWTAALKRAACIATACPRTTGSIFAEINYITFGSGITCIARLALANLLVILCGAQSILTAWLSNQTGYLAHMIIAGLVIGTIIIRAAFNFATAAFGITKEALFALTIGSMAASQTLGIATANSTTQTYIFTAGTSIVIHHTAFAGAAVCICSAQHLLGADVVKAKLKIWTG